VAARELLPNECVEEDSPLMEAGLDSISAIAFRTELNKAVGGRSIPATVLFDYPNIRQISAYLLAENTAAYAGATLSPHTTCDFQAKTHAQHSTNANTLRAYYI
jgi:aryl carrier-like protein